MKLSRIIIATVIILLITVPFLAGHRFIYGSSGFMEEMDKEVYNYLIDEEGYEANDILKVETEYNFKMEKGKTYLTNVELKSDKGKYYHIYGYSKEDGVWKMGRYERVE